MTPDPVSDPAPGPWYRRAFDASYEERYAHRGATEARRQIDWLRADGLLPERGRVLDLCCGGGRHLAELRERAYVAVGLDLSDALLRAARRRNGPRAPLLRADMRALPLSSRTFDAAIQMFTAFGYFEDDADNRTVLEEAARVLRPGASYVLDLMNPRTAIRDLVAESRRAGPNGAVLVERRWYDAARRRIEKETALEAAPHAEAPWRESVRVLEADEARAWLEHAGFGEIRVFGDYGGAPFAPETSARQVMVARRR